MRIAQATLTFCLDSGNFPRRFEHFLWTLSLFLYIRTFVISLILLYHVPLNMIPSLHLFADECAQLLT